MDLAKIRQKAKNSRPEVALTELSVTDTLAPDVLPEPIKSMSPLPVALADVMLESCVDTTSLDVTRSLPAATLTRQSHQISRSTVQFDPIKAILAGREAANCNTAPDIATHEQSGKDTTGLEEYLIFRVSDEIYGLNIMQIKEIIKPREVTEVPRTPSFVAGIISLRGVIVPIINMLERLGLEREAATGKERIIVVKNGETFSGLLVDEVKQVVTIGSDSFEVAPSVLEPINREFVAGIGREGEMMIILLKLESIVDINLF